MKKGLLQCEHFAKCSGCLFDQGLDNPPLLREIEQYFATHGVGQVVAEVGSIHGWRCRAKLAVRGTLEKPLVGLFRRNSHDVVDIPRCRVQHEAINRAAELIRAFIVQEQIVPYDEVRGIGDLRYVQLVLERSSGRVQVSFVVNQRSCEAAWSGGWHERLERLWNCDRELWQGLWLNAKMGRDNVIFGTEWRHCFGAEWLWERMGSVEMALSPSTFGQANLDLFDRLLGRMCSWVAPGSCVAEYYAGVGGIGLNLAVGGCRVRCCEIAPSAKRCFREALARLDPEVVDRVVFETGPASAFLRWIEECDVVVVDPPRKGLEAALLAKLVETTSCSSLIYVSCGWVAFQRDCDALVQGGWCVKQVVPFVLFPGTDQIELLVQFVPSSTKGGA